MIDLIGRLTIAAVGGLLAAQAMPPRASAWALLPLGIAVIYATAQKQRRIRSALIGLAGAVGYFAPLLSWMEVVGTDAWAMVVALCSIWWLVAFALLPSVRYFKLRSAAFATIWTGIEVLRDSVPWGGFGWGQFGVSVPLSPFAGLAPNVGQIGATWVIIFVTVWLADAIIDRSHFELKTSMAAAASVLLLIALTPFSYGVAVDTSKTTRVAVVQGGVDHYGLGSFGDLRAVLRHHVETTLDHKAEINTADLVVWPENAADINPQVDAVAAELMNQVVSQIDPPVLLGAVQVQPDNNLHNISLLWTNVGYVEKYVKRKVVPFGEFMPFRDFVTSMTDRAALMPRDFTPGTQHGSIDSSGVHLGILICFEVADTGFALTDDPQASAWIVHTNNATYQFKGQSEQQLLAARMRAAETQRPVIVSSTSGISAIIDAQGSVTQQISQTSTGVMLADLHQISGLTGAMMLHPILRGGFPIAALVLVLVATRRRRKVAQ